MANNTSDDELREKLVEILFKDGASNPDYVVDTVLLPLMKQREEQVAREAGNYGRLASLADLLNWLKLHDIEDVSMVQGYVEHCTKSIIQLPDQRYIEHPDIKEQLTTTHKGDTK